VGFSPPAAPGCWGSAIRVVDLTALAAAGEEAPGGSLPSTHHSCTHHLTELGGGEAAVSCAVLHFHEHPGDTFVVVGTVTGMTYHPRAHRGAALRTYRLVAMAGVPVDEEGREVAAGSPAASGTRTATRLQFLHRTPVEEAPYALAAFHGRLLAGVGRTLRLYDLGKRRLLRKGEARGFPTLITGLSPSLDRVFVADAAESVHVVRYRRSDGSLAVVADDVTARHTSALLPLDHDTVAAGDRFGNLFVLRMPPDADEEGADNPTGSRLLWSAGAGGGGAPNKLQQVAQFYVGEAVTGLQKGSLAGGSEVILYSTISGTVGCLAPLTAREDVDLLTHLELFLRHEGVSLLGRDHAAYRSYFIPLKVRAAPRGAVRAAAGCREILVCRCRACGGSCSPAHSPVSPPPPSTLRLSRPQDVVDGDLCEAFASLPAARQKAVAADLERTPGEVAKKLEDVRNRVL
jgi:splicing factor 3B subunit 3